MNRTKPLGALDDQMRSRTFIGFSRVSTEQQKENGDLLAQQEVIRTDVRQMGGHVSMIGEDVGSAHRDNCFSRLHGLQDVLRQAKAASGIVVVADVSRLSRNLSEYRKHIRPYGVPIYSVREGRILSEDELEDLIREAEAEAKRIGRDTKNALAGKERDVVASSEMRRRGSAWNIERQMRLEDDCMYGVQILRELGSDITAREFGEELIRRGRMPPRGTSFTLDTARDRLRDAREQMALEDLVNTEVLDDFDVDSRMAREVADQSPAHLDVHPAFNVVADIPGAATTSPVVETITTEIDERFLEDAFVRVCEPSAGWSQQDEDDIASLLDQKEHAVSWAAQGVPDFGFISDATDASHTSPRHVLKRRIRSSSPRLTKPRFRRRKRHADDIAEPGACLGVYRPGVAPEQHGRRQEWPQGAHRRQTIPDQRKARSARQRRSYGLCAAPLQRGIPGPRPELKERPPPHRFRAIPLIATQNHPRPVHPLLY